MLKLNPLLLLFFIAALLPSCTSAPEATRSQASVGDRLIISDTTTPGKQAGIAAIHRKDYTNAQTSLKASLNTTANDPEARIYLNNAIALSGRYFKLAVVIPGESDLGMSKEILRGVAQSQQEINDNGGVNGNKIVYAVVVDNDNANTGKDVARS